MARRVRRLLALVVTLAGLAAVGSSPASAKDAPKPAPPPKGAPGKAPGGKGAPARAEVVANALRRLDEDVFASERDMNEQHKIFTRSIAGLCFLLDPAGGRGAPHADRVDRCAESLGRYVDGATRHFEEGRRTGADEMSAFEWSQTTWSLGAAAIFYGECLARGLRRKDATARLRAIGELLAKSQQPDGGFGHDKDGRPRLPEIEMPLPGGGVKKMKYPNTLLSASNWAANALGIARAVSGKRLDEATAKAKGYYAATRDPEGTYPYDPSQKGQGGGDATVVARTAGSYVALRSLGVPARDKDLARTGSYLVRRIEDVAEGHGSSPHGVFFGRIATLLLGPAATKAYDEAILPRILAAADPATGALDCICRHGGATTCESFRSDANFTLKMTGGDNLPWVRAYVTSLNLFALLCEKGKLKLLDGLPADDGKAAPETTPETTPGEAPADGANAGPAAPPPSPGTAPGTAPGTPSGPAPTPAPPAPPEGGFKVK